MSGPNLKLIKVELDYSGRLPSLEMTFMDERTKKEVKVSDTHFTRRTLGLIEKEALEILQKELGN